MILTDFSLIASSTGYPTASAANGATVKYISDDGTRMLWVSNENQANNVFAFVWDRSANTHTNIPLPASFSMLSIRGGDFTKFGAIGSIGGTNAAYTYTFATSAWTKVSPITATSNPEYILFDSTARYCAFLQESAWQIYDTALSATLSHSITATYDPGYARLLNDYMVVINNEDDQSATKVYNLTGGYVCNLTAVVGASAFEVPNYYINSNGNYFAGMVWPAAGDYRYGFAVWNVATGAVVHSTSLIYDYLSPVVVAADGSSVLASGYLTADPTDNKFWLFNFVRGTVVDVSTRLSSYIGSWNAGDHNDFNTSCANSSFTTLSLVNKSDSSLGVTTFFGNWPVVTFLRKRLLGLF